MDLVFTAGSSNGAMQCIDIDVDIIDSPEDETFTVTLTASNSIVTFSNYVTTINIADTASKYEKDATSYTRAVFKEGGAFVPPPPSPLCHSRLLPPPPPPPP